LSFYRCLTTTLQTIANPTAIGMVSALTATLWVTDMRSTADQQALVRGYMPALLPKFAYSTGMLLQSKLKMAERAWSHLRSWKLQAPRCCRHCQLTTQHALVTLLPFPFDLEQVAVLFHLALCFKRVRFQALPNG
jgi:hypothetical protein